MRESTKYWEHQVNPELMIDLIRDSPVMTVNSDETVASLREALCQPRPMLEGVESEDVPGVGRMYFSREGGKCGQAAVLHIHGGGRIAGTCENGSNNHICSRIVKLLDVSVLCAKYRLAPNHPFPAALDDLVAAYKWFVDSIMKENPSATKESIRIVISGESAGGGLAVELCQRLFDERNDSDMDDYPLPVAQLLLYPMLDDRSSVDPDDGLPPHLIWSHASNLYAWTAYLGPDYKPGQDELPKYASASRRTNLEGLPPVWILVGDLDVFLSECQAFAKRMKDAGVPTEYVEVKGAYHGFVTLGTGEEPPVHKVWQSFRNFAMQYLRAV